MARKQEPGREERDEPTFEVDEEFDVDESEPTPRGGSGGAESVLLFLTGFAVAAGGLALAAAPNMSWQLSKIALKLDSMGLSSGTFIVGGLILLGLGMLSRSLGHAVQAAGADPQLLAELTDDTARTRASVARLERRVAFVGKTVQTQGQAQSEALAALPSQARAALETALSQSKSAGETEEGSGGKSDALWRLAASLDQLGARIDKGLDEHRGMLDAQLRQLWSELGVGTPPEARAAGAEAVENHDTHDTHETSYDDSAYESSSYDGAADDVSYESETSHADASEPDADGDFGGVLGHDDEEQLEHTQAALPAETHDEDETDVFGSLDEIEFLNDPSAADERDEPRGALPGEASQHAGTPVAQHSENEPREPLDFELLLPDDSIEAARRKNERER